MSDKQPPEQTPGAIDLDFTGVFTSAQLRQALEAAPEQLQPPPPAPAAPPARPVAPTPPAAKVTAPAPTPAARPASPPPASVAQAAPSPASTVLDKASMAAIAAAAAKARVLITPKAPASTAAPAPVAAPQPAPAAKAPAAPAPHTPRPVPNALLIGASQALAANSFYINVAKQRPQRKVDPARTTILMVEDDNTTRTVLSMVLSRSIGYQVRQAADAKGFVTALQQQPLPDVLILDLELPGEINGFRILDKVRKHPQLKNLPVIIFSGHTSPKDLERAIALGADAYLSKPAKVEAIIETLKAVLGG